MLITEIKDLVVAISAASAAIVAVRGLSAWRNELSGRAEFDIAKKLLVSTYRFRDAMRDCRRALVAESEFTDQELDRNSTNANEVVGAWIPVLEKRWGIVEASLENFENSAYEAEAFWGNDAKTACDDLLECAREVRSAFGEFIQDKSVRGLNFRGPQGVERGKEIRQIMFDLPSKDGNPLSIRINSAISDIEAMARPRLRAKSGLSIGGLWLRKKLKYFMATRNYA